MKFGSRVPSALIASAVVILGACSGSEDKAVDSAATPAASKDSMASMAGTPEVAEMGGRGMIDFNETHMRTFTATGADQVKAMLPEHRQNVANVISQMNQEMRSMNMASNAAWAATMDSVWQDPIHLPDMSAKALASSMPAHHARITRLLQIHRGMMAKMKP